jgi:hypothetical protein
MIIFQDIAIFNPSRGCPHDATLHPEFHSGLFTFNRFAVTHEKSRGTIFIFIPILPTSSLIPLTSSLQTLLIGQAGWLSTD